MKSIAYNLPTAVLPIEKTIIQELYDYGYQTIGDVQDLLLAVNAGNTIFTLNELKRIQSAVDLVNRLSSQGFSFALVNDDLYKAKAQSEESAGIEEGLDQEINEQDPAVTQQQPPTPESCRPAQSDEKQPAKARRAGVGRKKKERAPTRVRQPSLTPEEKRLRHNEAERKRQKRLTEMRRQERERQKELLPINRAILAWEKMQSETLSIDVLHLSSRTYNTLRRLHINNIDQLVEAFRYGIRKLDRLGTAAAKEAQERFIAYMLPADGTDAEENLSESIASGYHVDHDDIVAPDGRRLRSADLEEIGLSGRACSRLRRNGVASVLQLIGMEIEKLRKMPMLGVKLVPEIKDTVENWLSLQ